jgi:hypothetical protein
MSAFPAEIDHILVVQKQAADAIFLGKFRCFSRSRKPHAINVLLGCHAWRSGKHPVSTVSLCIKNKPTPSNASIRDQKTPGTSAANAADRASSCITKKCRAAGRKNARDA